METLPMFLGVLFAVLLLGSVLAGLAFGFSYLLFRLFGRTSGLDRLGEIYPASGPPEGEVFQKQWIAVGAVYYKNSADVGIGPRGLYLWVRPFLGQYRPVLVPWPEIGNPRGAILYWGKAVRVTVGAPEVTSLVFRESLFRRMMPYLESGGGAGQEAA